MQNPKENTLDTPKLILTSHGAHFISPLKDRTVTDTPPKLPVAPHSSPVDMSMESSKSNDNFRAELLKACLIKIPEAVFSEISLNEYLATSLSSDEDPVANLTDSTIGKYSTFRKAENLQFNLGVCLPNKTSDHDLAANWTECLMGESCIKLKKSEKSEDSFGCDHTVRLSLERHSKRNLLDWEHECFKLPKTAKLEDSVSECLEAGPSDQPSNGHLLDCSIYRKEGIEQGVFYDPSTDHLEIYSLNVQSSWNEYPDDIVGGRSPCSDQTSTIAVCASDTSDLSMDSERFISDENLSSREAIDSSVDEVERKSLAGGHSVRSSKKPRSALRRFLNWRRCLKDRKRAASLDESQFPFLANNIESYKTEFELSV